MMKRALFSRAAGPFWCLVFLVVSAPSPASAGGVYFVKKGDTLSKISRLFGVDAASLRESNGLASADLKPGDRLRIPDRAAKAPSAPEESDRRDISSDRVLQAICRDETVYHQVAKGDTLSLIARRYTTALDELLRLNGLGKRSRLSIGQKIVVRRSGPRSHTVQRGETLSRIAARYGVDAAELARLNRLKGTSIVVGQRLQIVPCDPYAAAGSAPPPLDVSGSAQREAEQLITALAESAAQPPVSDDGEAASPSVAAVAQRVITLARTMLDIPYRFGGTTLRGIDCSAYVQRVFSLLDVRLPRTAREQYRVGARIGRDELAVGDLVFFRTYASFPSHVGIYLGDNRFIHASSVGRKVTIDSIDLPYYQKRFLGARRLVVDESSSALASTP